MKNGTVPIKEKLSKGIALSKLAECLGISRPSLYKYMEAYDTGCIDAVPDNILKVFDKVSTSVKAKDICAYFDELVAEHERTEVRRAREEPVPTEIAEIVDGEDLDVADIDRMIGRAQRHLNRLLRREPADEDEIERTERDIRDLEYTRNMVEKRKSENRFVLIYSSAWTACTGPKETDVIDLDEDADTDAPNAYNLFRFYLTRARNGHTLFFCNEGEDNSVEVQLLTGPGDDRTTDVVGVFHPEPGMKFVRIPDLFDEDYEDMFRYRVMRIHDGNVLCSAVGRFTN